MLAAMVPAPGEPPGEWWGNTGWYVAHRAQAERDGRSLDEGFDPIAEFFHDVPQAVINAAMARGERAQSGTPFEKPWPLASWPDVPTRFLLCRDDRFFPADFQRRVVRERLGHHDQVSAIADGVDHDVDVLVEPRGVVVGRQPGRHDGVTSRLQFGHHPMPIERIRSGPVNQDVRCHLK